jgi:hypothetical protein
LFPSKRRGTRWWAALGGHLRYRGIAAAHGIECSNLRR